MYVVMKEGKYFTGKVTHPEIVDLLWTRRLSGAKVWKEKRTWAQRAAENWGGKVVEVQEDELAHKMNHTPNTG